MFPRSAFIMAATTGVYPERSRRAPTQVWRGRPRPRKEPFGWRSHFGNRFVGHVHSSLTRNSAATHSGIGDGGRGRPPHMATLAPKGKGRPCFHDQPLLWPRRLEFTLSEAEGLPHRCGAGALARENTQPCSSHSVLVDVWHCRRRLAICFLNTACGKVPSSRSRASAPAPHEYISMQS